MARTTAAAVQRVLGPHYDTQNLPALDPFIKTANVLTNQVALQSIPPSASELAEIECYLAAHFYAHADQIEQSKTTGQATGQFQGTTALVLMGTQYGQTACLLDSTGYLQKRSKEAETGMRRIATCAWLGSDPVYQTPYEG